jgi:hypothetical protein
MMPDLARRFITTALSRATRWDAAQLITPQPGRADAAVVKPAKNTLKYRGPG